MSATKPAVATAPTTSGTITGRGMTMSDLVARHARLRPDEIAMVDPTTRRTYRELDDRITRLGNALAARGVGAGDRVSVLGRNRIEVVESWLAVLRIGAVAVLPRNPSGKVLKTALRERFGTGRGPYRAR